MKTGPAEQSAGFFLLGHHEYVYLIDHFDKDLFEIFQSIIASQLF